MESQEIYKKQEKSSSAVKYELNQIRTISKLVNCKLGQIKELKSLKTSIKSTIITGLPKSVGYSNSDKVESLIDKVDELQEVIQSDINELIDLRLFWISEVKKLDYVERLLIESRYFEGKSWLDIAKELNYEERQIYRLHGKILKKMSVNVMKCQ